MPGALQDDVPDRRRHDWATRLQARLATLSNRPATLAAEPEPRSVGSFAAGRRLCDGKVLLAGHAVDLKGGTIWDVPAPGRRFDEARHGFAWLDDLAAVADGRARAVARDWTLQWIARYGRGRGPGWQPDLAGRRMVRWLHHAPLLLGGLDRTDAETIRRALANQATFLARRWRAARPGLARFEALTGLLYAAVFLSGPERRVTAATGALERECARCIDKDGAIASRNPEELLEIFTLLTWAEAALARRDRAAGAAHRAAIARVAPVLRALRHADGGLARFHGGGPGREGRLDGALAEARIKSRPVRGLVMGYARLAAGRTTVIVDAARPAALAFSQNAHASTLAFELTSGRRPLIVNCGSGDGFGEDWRRAGRATQSHSTLEIEGYSSSRLGPAARGTTRLLLVEAPETVEARAESGLAGHALTAWHDGYGPTHGLTHVRQLTLAYDGRALSGEETLAAFTETERARFEGAMRRAGPRGIAFAVRFHLHPDVDATIDMGGAAVSLALRSGEIWVFRHDGAADLALERSVYLEAGRRGAPRATKQIVLSARAMDYASLITWTLAKAQETPRALRDLEPDDPFEETPRWTRPGTRHEG